MPLSDVRVHVRFKLAALWAAVMFCYIYGDLFGFFRADLVRDVVAGNAGPIGTHLGLLAAAALMTVPSVMVFFSLALAPRACRYANLGFGVAYTAVIIATMPGAWEYYLLLGAIEAALTIAVVWHAWTWPRRDARSAA